MQGGYGGPLTGVGCGKYPHAIHTHANCLTVDISSSCSPSILMDICKATELELLSHFEHKKFDLVVLENLPLECYFDYSKFVAMVSNCAFILSDIGKIFLPYIPSKAVGYIKCVFALFAFRLIQNSSDCSSMYPTIWKLAGAKYVDEYMMVAKLWCRKYCSELDTSFLLFSV